MSRNPESGDRPETSRPSLKEQAVVTVKVMLVTGAVLAGIWLLDAIATQ